MLNRIFAFLFLCYVVVTSCLFFICSLTAWAFTRPFDSKLRILNRMAAWWAMLYIKTMPAWHLNTEGFEHIDRSQNYIIVSNHQSMLDIVVGFALPISFKWVAKAELFSVPIIGWNMVLNQDIRISRGEMKSTREMLRRCDETLEKGHSIFIFPEGTRSLDGKLQHFKTGAFTLSAKQSIPILPVAIIGTAKALPKFSFKFHGRQNMTIRALPPMMIDLASGETPAAFAVRVQLKIAAEIEEPTTSATLATSATSATSAT